MKRAAFVGGSLAAFTLPFATAVAEDVRSELARIEASTGGRLGVAALDTGSGRRVEYRADDRFPMCSTFKLLLVSSVLARVDRGQEQLTRRVLFTKADLEAYAPVARKHLTQGFMTVEELSEAAIVYSDNTAANLLLQSIRGPHALTAYARSIGDPVTRLDRTEPSLNTAIPGDPRDTTTPAAMLRDLQRITMGNALSASSRGTLERWLIACRTGTNLLRAGFPRSWRVGDKTGLGGPHNGTGDSNTRNDIAIAWPPNRAPILVAVYLTQSQVSAAKRDGALSGIGRLIASAL